MKNVISFLLLLTLVSAGAAEKVDAVVLTNGGKLILHPASFCLFVNEKGLSAIDHEWGDIANTLTKERVSSKTVRQFMETLANNMPEGSDIQIRIYHANVAVRVIDISYLHFIDIAQRCDLKNAVAIGWLKGIQASGQATGSSFGGLGSPTRPD